MQYSMRFMTNPRLWYLLTACAGLALVCALYPIYVIRPFRAQGPQELEAALLVMRFRPVLTLLCLGGAVLAGWRLRNGLARRPGQWAAGVAVVLTLLATIAVRVNVFEMMFHPVDQPTFLAAAEAKLDADEMVLAVQQRGAARAYPVRAIAYHHIVNDVVGGVPLVATY